MQTTSPYPIQVAILTIASLIPTFAYIYLLWQWRSMTDRRWLKALFTGVPIFLVAVLGYRLGTFLGYDNAEVLLALQYLSVIASYALVYAFWTATQVMKDGRIILQRRMEEDGKVSDKVWTLIEIVEFKRDHLIKHFLKKAEV